MRRKPTSSALSVEQELDLLPGDPFAFLVIEQIVKAKALSRVGQMSPLRYMLGSQKAQYDQDMQAYRQVCWICDQKFAELIQRILTIQVDDSLLEYELALKRRRRAEQLKDQIQELHDQHTLETERLRIQGLGHSDRMKDIERRQKQLDLEHSRELNRQSQSSQAANAAQLEYHRSYFEQVTKVQAEQFNNHTVRMAELDHTFQLMMAEATPDKNDPAYIAGRQREAYKVYTKMVKDVMKNTKLSNEEKRRDVKLIFEMAGK